MNKAVTQSGAGRISDRMDVFNDIERNRAAVINQQLADEGRTERVEHSPTTEILRPAGASDDLVDMIDKVEDDTSGKTIVAKDDDGKKAGDDGGEKATIYEFLGEDDIAKSKIKVKVDGKEQDIALADLVKGHQKTAAADKRLEEASIKNKEADRLLKDAQENADRIVREATERATNSTAGADKDGAGKEKQDASPSGKDAIAAAMQFVYEGDQAQAAELLDAEIERRVQAKTGATVDSDQVANKVKTDLAWDTALSAFNTDHKEIAEDPDLRAMFQTRLNTAAAKASTPQEAIDAALEAMPSWLSKVSDAPDGAADKGKLKVDEDALKKRQEDKAQLDTVQSNSSIRSQSNAAADEVYDPSKVVAEMKASRGQKD